MEDITNDDIPIKKPFTSRKKKYIYNPNFFINLKNSPYNNLLQIPAPNKNIFTNYATKINKKNVKTVDMTFTAAVVRPYVPDLISPTGIVVNSTGMIQNLAAIQQGTGEFQRVGNKVALKSLRIRFRARNSGFDYNEVSTARFMILYDRQPNGAYPTISTVLNTARQDGTGVGGTLDSNINANLLERFIVVMDKYFPLPPSDDTNNAFSTGSTAPLSFCIDEFLKLKNLETVYNATASPMTIAQVQTGALYLLVLGNVTTGTEPFFFQGEVRLRYRDV